MPKDESFDVLLVRSGATPWTAEQRIQGHTDLPLTDEARAEAGAHFGSIELPPLTLIASGKAESTVATADVLASLFESCKHKKIAELSEINLGLWEGLLEADVRERYAKAFGAWRQDPTTVTPPDGESLANVEERACKAVRKLLEKAQGPIAIVVRPVVLGVLLCRAHNTPLQELWTVLEDAQPTTLETLCPGQFRPKAVAAETGA